MTTLDRTSQLEQVARLIVESDFGYRLADEHWSRWLEDYRNPALRNPGSHGIVAFRHAEIALSLAEDTREEDAKWHDGEMSGSIALAESAERNGDHDDARIHRLSAAEHRHTAAAIRAMPISIGKAATKEIDHD